MSSAAGMHILTVGQFGGNFHWTVLHVHLNVKLAQAEAWCCASSLACLGCVRWLVPPDVCEIVPNVRAEL